MAHDRAAGRLLTGARYRQDCLWIRHEKFKLELESTKPPDINMPA
jgi:hypothetical protein